MSDSRFERVARLFLDATALSGDQLEARLVQESRDAPSVVEEVRSMLRQAGRSNDLLDTGGLARVADELLDAIPERIGPYQVVERLGEGGMGVVYRARQIEPLRREVAIKVVRGGLRSSDALIRFESERQTLAQMKHPCIAQVFDAGVTDDVRPYFVMEYVRGEPITTFADQNQLSLERRLELFSRVCEGVQHAHQNAVIHRDLKPSNVLVTIESGDALPKIIDFGIAKALRPQEGAATHLGKRGRILGTLEYMSPEQASFEHVDTRSDVYSLGVLLYELLVGTRPFEIDATTESAREDFTRRLRSERPTPPGRRVAHIPPAVAATRSTDLRRLRKQLRGDLDAIVSKALEKSPDRRYASAAALAADVERFVRQQPVHAVPATASYRLRKLAGRHRAATGLAAALVVTIVASFGLARFQAIRLDREARRVAEEAAAASEASSFVLGAFGGLRSLVNVRRAHGGKPLQSGLRPILSGARESLPDNPALRARFLVALGDSLVDQGHFADAFRFHAEAMVVCEQFFGPLAEATLAVKERVVGLRIQQSELDDAERLLRDVLATRRRLGGAEAASTLRSELLVGSLSRARGRHAEAVDVFERVLPRLAREVGEASIDVLTGSAFLAGSYLEVGRYRDALTLLEQIIDPMRGVLGDRHVEVVIATYNLACANANLGRIDGALGYLRESVLSGWGYPGSLRGDRHLRPLFGRAEFEEIDAMEKFNSVSEWTFRIERAQRYTSAGNPERAEQILQNLLAAIERTTGRESVAAGEEALFRLGEALAAQGGFEEAGEAYRKVLDEARLQQRPDLERKALWYAAQGKLGLGDRAAARDLLEAVLAVERDLDPATRHYAEAAFHAVSGDRRLALDRLAASVESGYQDAEWLSRDLAFAELRGDAEFESLANRIRERLP